MKARGYKFPVLVIVDNLNAVELVEVMSDWKAVNIIQRPQSTSSSLSLSESMPRKEKGSLNLGKQLLPRLSKEWQEIGRKDRYHGEVKCQCHSVRSQWHRQGAGCITGVSTECPFPKAVHSDRGRRCRYHRANMTFNPGKARYTPASRTISCRQTEALSS